MTASTHSGRCAQALMPFVRYNRRAALTGGRSHFGAPRGRFADGRRAASHRLAAAGTDGTLLMTPGPQADRFPRERFTRSLLAMCEQLDACHVRTFDYKSPNSDPWYLQIAGRVHAKVLGLWAFGSWAPRRERMRRPRPRSTARLRMGRTCFARRQTAGRSRHLPSRL